MSLITSGLANALRRVRGAAGGVGPGRRRAACRPRADRAGHAPRIAERAVRTANAGRCARPVTGRGIASVSGSSAGGHHAGSRSPSLVVAPEGNLPAVTVRLFAGHGGGRWRWPRPVSAGRGRRGGRVGFGTVVTRGSTPGGATAGLLPVGTAPWRHCALVSVLTLARRWSGERRRGARSAIDRDRRPDAAAGCRAAARVGCAVRGADRAGSALGGCGGGGGVWAPVAACGVGACRCGVVPRSGFGIGGSGVAVTARGRAGRAGCCRRGRAGWVGRCGTSAVGSGAFGGWGLSGKPSSPSSAGVQPWVRRAVA